MTTAQKAMALVHAHLESRKPESAYSILCGLTAEAMPEMQTRVEVTLLKHRCLCEMNPQGDRRRLLLHFNAALMAFYQVTDILPDCGEVYERQAAFWRRIGDSARAAHLLRTLQVLKPDSWIPPLIRAYEQADSLMRDATEMLLSDPVSPSKRPLPESWTPKVLLITHSRSHYGLDVLYDGLCTVLGDDNVTEYPWKPLLHGGVPEELGQYPCTLNRKGTAYVLEELLARLESGFFDIVLYGDFETGLDQETARKIIRAAGRTPVFLVDAQDECTDVFDDIAAFLGGEYPTGCFKREMLAVHDYGEHVFPLPFAYPDDRVWLDPVWERPIPFFWAGQRWCGLRDLYLHSIEKHLNCQYHQTYTQDEYVKAMRSSCMGLAGFGAGFDTVRYWELPAQGCLLIAERSPLRIPHDFKDEVSAVLFSDLYELEQRFPYYVAHPERVVEMARMGHENLVQYHTASARARQLLEVVFSRIQNG